MTSLLLHPIGMQDESMEGNLHKFVKFSLQIANMNEVYPDSMRVLVSCSGTQWTSTDQNRTSECGVKLANQEANVLHKVENHWFEQNYQENFCLKKNIT